MIEKKINEYIKELSDKENLSTEEIKNMIISLFENFYKGAELLFDFSKEKLIITRVYKIVKEIKKEEKELKEGDKLIKKGITKDEKVYIYLDLENKNTSNYLKENFEKSLKRIKMKDKYRKGQIVYGEVNYYVNNGDRNNLSVNLENGIKAIWNKKESESFNFNKKSKLYFIIKEIINEEIILTREGKDFIVEVMKKEIPEVQSGIILVVEIIMPRGADINKIIIKANTNKSEINLPNILGTCVGLKGQRIEAISNIVGKRLDIALWFEKKEKLILGLLSPIKVVSIQEEEEKWKVIIPGDKSFFINTERGKKLLEAISNYVEKKIEIQILEELWNKGKNNIGIIWNGSMTLEEYKKKR